MHALLATDAVTVITGSVIVNTPDMPPLKQGDTRGRRLAYARWLTAGRNGVAELGLNEMSRVVRDARGISLADNAYSRWEGEKSNPSDDWLEAIGKVAGVNWLWLRYGSEAPVPVPVPDGYEEWLARKTAGESGASAIDYADVELPLDDEEEIGRGKKRKRKRGRKGRGD